MENNKPTNNKKIEYQKEMWKQWDSNKIVGTQMKVEAYKNHLSNLKKAKSILKI